MHAENQSRDDLFGPVLFSRRSAQVIRKQIRTVREQIRPIFRDHRRGICVWLGFAVLFGLTIFPPWEVIRVPDGEVFHHWSPANDQINESQMPKHPRIDQLPIWFSTHICADIDYKTLLTKIGLGECFVLALYLTWGKTSKGERK